MGRTRSAYPRRTSGRRRVILSRFTATALAIAWILAGCKQITGDLDRVIALEIGDFARDVEVGDTLRLMAQALTASGNVAPDAEIVWALLDVDSGPTVLELDPAGVAVGAFPGMQRVQARIEELRSDPIGITVTAAPDSIAAFTPERVTVPVGDTQSGDLSVILFERVTDPGQPTPLAGKTATFRLIDPVPGTAGAEGIELAVADTVATADPQRGVAVSQADGVASARVRVTMSRPDSVAIDVTAVTALGEAVRGSPVRFTVVFEPNS